MVMYLIENTERDEIRFFGKEKTFISAKLAHRFVVAFALDHGYHSFYEADLEARKLPGDRNAIVTVRI